MVQSRALGGLSCTSPVKLGCHPRVSTLRKRLHFRRDQMCRAAVGAGAPRLPSHQSLCRRSGSAAGVASLETDGFPGESWKERRRDCSG
ncbi:hypothetical protein SRHO_G00214030 [Serrasalmus rhombeus]